MEEDKIISLFNNAMRVDELGRIVIDDQEILNSISGALAASQDLQHVLDSDCSCNSGCGNSNC